MEKPESYNISKLELGKRLYDERTLRGVTQKEAAKALGVSNNTVNNWEVGKFYPKINKISVIAEYYGCDPSYLISAKTTFRTLKTKEASLKLEALNKRIGFLIDKDSSAKKERDFLTAFYEDYMGWSFFGWCGLREYKNGATKHQFIPSSMKRVSNEAMDAFMKELEENFVSVAYESDGATTTDASGKISKVAYPDPDQTHTAAIDEYPEHILHGRFIPQYYIFTAEDGYHVFAISEFLNLADTLKAFIKNSTQSMESRLPVLRGWNDPNSKALKDDILRLYMPHIK